MPAFLFANLRVSVGKSAIALGSWCADEKSSYHFPWRSANWKRLADPGHSASGPAAASSPEQSE